MFFRTTFIAIIFGILAITDTVCEVQVHSTLRYAIDDNTQQLLYGGAYEAHAIVATGQGPPRHVFSKLRPEGIIHHVVSTTARHDGNLWHTDLLVSHGGITNLRADYVVHGNTGAMVQETEVVRTPDGSNSETVRSHLQHGFHYRQLLRRPDGIVTHHTNLHMAHDGTLLTRTDLHRMPNDDYTRTVLHRMPDGNYRTFHFR